MQINGFGGVSAYNPIARTNSVSKMKSVQLPEFGYGKNLIPTYTPTDRSDEEIKADIIELAKQDARKGIFGQDLDKTLTNSRPSKEWQALVGEYIQSVSPDRRSIFPATLAQLGKATKLQGGTPIIDDSLLQLLLNGTKVGVNNKPGFQPGVQYDDKSRMMQINYFGITAGGEDIGSYSITYGWGSSPTKEEHARSSEITGLYYDTWKAETAALNADKSETSAAQAYSGSFVQPQAIQSTTAQQAISRYEQMQPEN